MTSNSLIALLAWIALMIVLQLAGIPATRFLFGRFADRGFGLVRLTTLLICGYAVWILASLEIISFRAIWCWIAVAGLAVPGWLLTRRQRRFSTPRRSRKREQVGAEVTFWSVFALFLLFRWVNPDSWNPIWGGEKPMEFAHLNAILRSAHFPPYDPWFAGGYINYYYYGSYLVAVLIKLTGIPSEIAFNLAQPTFIALLASAAYSVSATLGRDLTGRRIVRGAGWLGAAILVLLGNLSSAIKALETVPIPLDLNFYDWTWAGSRVITGGITEFPYFTGLYADLHAHVEAWPITIFVIALCYALVLDARPFALAVSQSSSSRRSRTFVLAKLGMLSLSLGSLFATNAWDVAVYAALATISVFLALRLLPWMALRLAVTATAIALVALVGFVMFIPFLSHYVTLYSSLEQVRSQTAISEFLTHVGGLLLMVGLGMLLLFVMLARERLPAWLRDPFPALGLTACALVVSVLLIELGGKESHVAGIVLVLGVTVGFGFAAYPAVATEDDLRSLPLLWLLVGSAAAIFSAAADRGTAGLAVAFATAAGVLWLTARDPAIRFLSALIAAGSLVIAGVDTIFLVDDLAPDPIYYRMNTIFKFYNQVWTLLALSAALCVAIMIDRATKTEIALATEGPEYVDVDLDSNELTTGTDNQSGTDLDSYEIEAMEPFIEAHRFTPSNSARTWSMLGLGLAAVAIAAAMIYPILTTKPRLDQRFPGHPTLNTLDSLDWMRYGTITNERGVTIAFADDLNAIRWFQDHVDGTPTIAEASIGPYRGNGSRFSIATGLPDILGWDRHERQQRYAADIEPRVSDVRTLYTSSDVNQKLDILRAYDVQYVVVGDVERNTVIGGAPYASTRGIAAFETMVGTSLEIAFQSGSTTVYRVLPPDDANTAG